LLLIVLGLTFIPWQMVCVSHPFGHEHHEHDGPSPCEIRRAIMQQPGEHVLPPMECEHITPATDDFQTSLQLKTPTIDQFIIAAVLLDFLKRELPEQEFYPLPDPHSNSDPPLGINALRGPPFV